MTAPRTGLAVHYLNQACVFRLGVPLLDASSGVTIEDALKGADFDGLRDRLVYRGGATNLYKVYSKTFAKNTNLPTGIKLRPHGSRTYMVGQYARLAESGLISQAVVVRSPSAAFVASPLLSHQRPPSPPPSAGCLREPAWSQQGYC